MLSHGFKYSMRALICNANYCVYMRRKNAMCVIMTAIVLSSFRYREV